MRQNLLEIPVVGRPCHPLTGVLHPSAVSHLGDVSQKVGTRLRRQLIAFWGGEGGGGGKGGQYVLCKAICHAKFCVWRGAGE